MQEMKRSRIIILFLIFLLPFLATSQNAEFSADQLTICLGETIQFTDESTGSVTSWLWDFGNGETTVEQNPQFIYTDPGVYTVSLSINEGADTEEKIEYIRVLPTPNVDFDTILSSANRRAWFYIGFEADSIYVEDLLTLYLYWNFGDDSVFADTIPGVVLSNNWYSPSPYHLYNEPGTYNVFYRATFSNGCMDSITKTITINNRDSLFLPNVFTPDGDGINDNFVIGSNGLDLYSIIVYSRWGNIVYKSDAVQQIVWDGRTIDGTKIEPGIYYYVVIQESGVKEYVPKQGFVHIYYKP